MDISFTTDAIALLSSISPIRDNALQFRVTTMSFNLKILSFFGKPKSSPCKSFLRLSTMLSEMSNSIEIVISSLGPFSLNAASLTP